MPVTAFLELLDWRRRMSELYAAVRADDDPRRAHARWRATRDTLISTHPQSPAPPGATNPGHRRALLAL